MHKTYGSKKEGSSQDSKAQGCKAQASSKAQDDEEGY
jgi:hypothetical protein